MTILDLERLASTNESLRLSIGVLTNTERAAARLASAYTVDRALMGVIDARKTAIESSLSGQIEASVRAQRDALRNAGLERSLKSVLATHNAIEASLASQLEASVRTQREALRSAALERSLATVLGTQRAVEASLARALKAALGQRQDALRSVSVAAIQSTARQQEILAESLRSLSSFGNQPLSDLIRGRNVLPSGALGFSERSISGALGSWERALGRDFVRDIQSALASQVAEENDSSIVEAVTEAVGQALQRNESRTDWRFVAALVVTILLFLYQNESANQDQAVLREAVAEVQERLLSQESLLHLLLTKEVSRSTPLYSKPTSKSRLLMRLEPGTVVIVLGRRSKWTRIGLRSRPNGTSGSPSGGWMLNKYLK